MAEDHKPKPQLRVAAENDRSVLDHERARRDIEWPLRNLAANMMRISRGAGAPYEVGRQCQDVVESFVAYWKRCGVWPSSEEVSEILSFRESPHPRDLIYDLERAIEEVTKGALRFAAGRLVDQRMQADHGEKELLAGVDRIERYREEMRAYWAKKAAESQKPKTPPAKKRTAAKAKRRTAKAKVDFKI